MTIRNTDQKVDRNKWEEAEYWKQLEKKRELEKRSNREVQQGTRARG